MVCSPDDIRTWYISSGTLERYYYISLLSILTPASKVDEH
jgi:hypothetical protein